jgi:UDP-N-acetyl-D-mannosaminuronic acid dehydrogenase
MSKKNITIFGLGYIGLPTAAILAESGHIVNGVDVSEDIVNGINNSKTHFFEPKLDELVTKNISNKNLKASLNPNQSDIFIICVPTPFKYEKDERIPDISFIQSAVSEIIKVIKPGDLIILESTSPVGTTDKIAKMVRSKIEDDKDIHYAYCPERVLPGNIVKELVENDRIVGGVNEISTKVAVDFYKTFVKGEIHATNARTAEMCKLTENSFRDVNIAFANELSIICDKYDVNDRDLINLANFHPRVNILQPGVGVGGHCIAVDPWFLISDLPEQTNLIKKSREVNLYKTQWVQDKIKESINLFVIKNNFEPTIACMGLTFKPNVDDMRESPALIVAKEISEECSNVILVEPHISNADLGLSKIDYALDNADIFIFLVAHDCFAQDVVIKTIKEKSYLDFTGVIKL